MPDASYNTTLNIPIEKWAFIDQRNGGGGLLYKSQYAKMITRVKFKD